MFKHIKQTFNKILWKQAHKMIAANYVKECARLAGDDNYKLLEYLKPSIEPICLFVTITTEDDKGRVADGDFVTVNNDHGESWVLAFDDYVHAEEVCDEYEKVVGVRPMPRKTTAESIYSQEAPVMGAICCKYDGTTIETHKYVYRTLIREMYMKARLKQARTNELRKRLDNE